MQWGLKKEFVDALCVMKVTSVVIFHYKTDLSLMLI